MLNPLTLNPLQIKLAAIGAMLVAAALAGLTIWALMERSGRLECKVELVAARDQVDVLAHLLDEQTKSINDLGAATRRARTELRGLVAKVDAQHEETRRRVAELEQSVKSPTPRAADGRLFDCRDAIRIWREELKGGRK